MMSDKILVKQIANATTMQMVGGVKNKPSFLDFARNTFGQRGQGITPGQRARGLVGMGAKAAAAGVTALNMADSAQQGNVSAPLQAGISYQGIDPTATIDPNVGDKINQNAQFQNPTPTYDFTHSSYPIHQFVPGVSPAGVAVQQPVQAQQSAGYGPVQTSPALGQLPQPAPPAQAQPAQPAQAQPVDNSHLQPVAISTGTVVPMGGAQADAMGKPATTAPAPATPATQTATPNALDTKAMMGAGGGGRGFVGDASATMHDRSKELQGLAPVNVRQPIQQPPQGAPLDSKTRQYLESLPPKYEYNSPVKETSAGQQGFQNLNFNTADGAGQAYNQGIGVNNSPFKRKVTLPDGREIEVSNDQLIRNGFTDMLFDILGPDNLYKMTPNEIGELAAFMYIKTR